jgi:hypothetical protein
MRARGPANQFPCVGDCGRQAEDWSQKHGTTGDDPEHHEPRCRKCHKTYDAEHVARGEHVNTALLSEARVRGIRASVGATQDELVERIEKAGADLVITDQNIDTRTPISTLLS